MNRLNLKYLYSTPLKDLRFAIVDTETTGMRPNQNRVMDIGIVIIENLEIVEKWETLIDPEQEISYWITHYTNIRAEHVVGKPKFAQVAPEIESKLQNSIFVAHNVGFDYGFLRQEFKRIKREFDPNRLCTVRLGRRLHPKLKRANLDVLSKHYNINIVDRHRALPDAEATAIIFQNFLKIAMEEHAIKNFLDLEKLQHKPINIQTITTLEEDNSRTYIKGLF